ncbi:hypothetical protein Knedl_CDS0019 [Pseudomonas phage Knedl]|nr:hypothetical protein Knedl_CDS0019 [Pseudomonas phage Knedl]
MQHTQRESLRAVAAMVDQAIERCIADMRPFSLMPAGSLDAVTYMFAEPGAAWRTVVTREQRVAARGVTRELATKRLVVGLVGAAAQAVLISNAYTPRQAQWAASQVAWARRWLATL